jgi:hypothetical protein
MGPGRRDTTSPVGPMHPASHNDPFVIMTLVPPGS